MSEGMSIDKWRVRKLAYPDGHFGPYPWYVIPPGVPSPKDPNEAYDCYCHYESRLTLWRSHRMALIVAFDQSRKGPQEWY